MFEKDKKYTSCTPVFGKDIVDDWSWDREELRESNDSEND